VVECNELTNCILVSYQTLFISLAAGYLYQILNPSASNAGSRPAVSSSSSHYAYPLQPYVPPPVVVNHDYNVAPPYAPPLPGYSNGNQGDYKNEKEQEAQQQQRYESGFQRPLGIHDSTEEVRLEPRVLGVEGRI
jgi:hypothetical protein